MMKAATTSRSEHDRLDCLRSFLILDTEREAAFDALVRLASATCGAPMAMISLVDSDRLWFKASIGLGDQSEAPREDSFCAHVIDMGELVEVGDARQDARFGQHPMVVGAPGVRFYAGMPIILHSHCLGSLCVMDQQARQLSAAQKASLQDIVTLIEKLLLDRRRDIDATLRARADHEMTVSHVNESMRIVLDNMPAMMAFWGGDLRNRFANRDYSQWIGKPADQIIGRHITEVIKPAVYAANARYIEGAMAGQEQRFEREMRTPEGLRHLMARYIPYRDGAGNPDGFFVLITDITERRRAELALQDSERSYRRVLDAAQMGIWVYNPATMSINFDHIARDLHGLQDERMTADRFLALTHAEDRPQLMRLFNMSEGLFNGPVREYVFEARVQHAAGHYLWMEIVAKLHVNDKGREGLITCSSRDITERRRLLADLSEQHERLRVTLHSIGDAVITTDRDSRIEYLNPVAEALTGWSSEEVKGMPLALAFNVVHGITREPAMNPVARCLSENTVVELDDQTVLISRSGQEYGIEDSAAPIRDNQGNILGVVLVFHDVTEQRRLAGEVYYQATHDPLTGLVNRKEFEKKLYSLLAGVKENHRDHAFLFVDLDQFKLVNDICGHSVGDKLLQSAATLIERSVRAGDTVARFGGDEFGVILENCGLDSARSVAQKVCERLNEFLFIHDKQRFQVGASIGLVMVRPYWDNIGEIIQAADAACHAAKNSGRGCVHVCHEVDSVVDAQIDRVNWAGRISAALENDHFELYAQLISPTEKAGGGLHCEVLLRMRGENGEIIPPGAFMPSAERFHMASRIDRWVIRHVLDMLQLEAPGLKDVEQISINLSGQSLGNKEFHRFVEELLASSPVDLSKICFEVTETSAISSLEDARGFINRLASYGVGFSLDDFGSGMSSFAYLKALPVKYLKIDGQFVKNVAGDAVDCQTVRCIAELGRALGKRTIAEFVETENVRQILQDMGVDYVQGYLMHRPEPLSAVLFKHGETQALRLRSV
jgi:diguanylate cyclase (GGDEF)-like protein/PAS domain S-box-containing protein